jgi:hypothetical protein
MSFQAPKTRYAIWLTRLFLLSLDGRVSPTYRGLFSGKNFAIPNAFLREQNK